MGGVGNAKRSPAAGRGCGKAVDPKGGPSARSLWKAEGFPWRIHLPFHARAPATAYNLTSRFPGRTPKIPMKLLKGARFTRPAASTVVIQAMGRGMTRLERMR